MSTRYKARNSYDMIAEGVNALTMQDSETHTSTLNIQSYMDIRLMASLDRFFRLRGIVEADSMSQLVRGVLECLCQSLKQSDGLETFLRTEDAIEWFQKNQIRLGQLKREKIQRRVSLSIQAENLAMENLFENKEKLTIDQVLKIMPEYAEEHWRRMREYQASLEAQGDLSDVEIVERVYAWRERDKARILACNSGGVYHEEQDETTSAGDFEKILEQARQRGTLVEGKELSEEDKKREEKYKGSVQKSWMR